MLGILYTVGTIIGKIPNNFYVENATNFVTIFAVRIMFVDDLNMRR